MTDYEIAEQERATLYERIKLVKEEMQSIADPQELAKQKQRYSILYQMYQEALERKDAARPPAEGYAQRPKAGSQVLKPAALTVLVPSTGSNAITSPSLILREIQCAGRSLASALMTAVKKLV